MEKLISLANAFFAKLSYRANKLLENLLSFANEFFAKLYVPADKQAHLLSGFIIALLFTPIVGVYAIAVVAVIAWLKEKYDGNNKDKHTADFWDWAATAIGGLAGLGLFILI